MPGFLRWPVGLRNISHKPGIVTPVGSELKFQNQTGGDTYGEIDSKQFHPKLGCVFQNSLPVVT